jgi:hypothetical protein
MQISISNLSIIAFTDFSVTARVPIGSVITVTDRFGFGNLPNRTDTEPIGKLPKPNRSVTVITDFLPSIIDINDAVIVQG